MLEPASTLPRSGASRSRYGASAIAFSSGIYTPGEVAYCLQKRQSAESFAARFAAKEAGAKALGTGIQHGVSWRELEVVRAPGQRPTLQLHGRAAEIGERLGVRRTWLAITHGAGVAIATVHMEGSPCDQAPVGI